MKKINREITSYETIFVSVDGKEFKTETDCKEWEKSYKGTLTASWQLIKKIEINDTCLGIPYSSDDHECYIVKPKDLDEIALINAYIAATTCYSDPILNSSHIGNLTALNFGFDHDYCEAYIIDGIITDISNYIAKKTAEFEEV